MKFQAIRSKWPAVGWLGVWGLLSILGTDPLVGQIHILGRMDQDRFLAKFWSQNQNASNLVAGLNTTNAAGLIRFLDALLPLTISNKTFSGTFDLTNAPIFRTWDSAAGAWQNFDWLTSNQVPTTTNTVSRVGFPETLKYKTLNELLLQNGGSPLTGVVRANGASYADTIAGLSGTNTVYLGGNYFTFVDGVLTGWSGTANPGLLIQQGLTNTYSVNTANFAIGSGAGSLTNGQTKPFLLLSSFVSTPTLSPSAGDTTWAPLAYDPSKARITWWDELTGEWRHPGMFYVHTDIDDGTQTVNFDFTAANLDISQNTVITNANLSMGRNMWVTITNWDAAAKTLTFPNWRWTTAVPATIAGNGSLMLMLACLSGSAEGDVAAAAFTTTGAGFGDVTGPGSSTTGGIPVFSDTTGKVLTTSTASITSGRVSAANFIPAHSAIAYAGSVAVDFAGDGLHTIALTGNLTLTSSNLAAGRTVTIRLACDGTARTLSFPSWKFVGGAPSTLAASKTAVITMTSFGTTDADVVAAYSSEF